MALTAADRCDRCVAQAYVTVDSISWAASLLFCARHYSEHVAALLFLESVVIIDERSDDMKWREVGER